MPWGPDAERARSSQSWGLGCLRTVYVLRLAGSVPVKCSAHLGTPLMAARCHCRNTEPFQVPFKGDG